MRTNKCVYDKVIEKHLVQRNQKILEKKKGNKKMEFKKRQIFKICKMLLGGNDNIKINW